MVDTQLYLPYLQAERGFLDMYTKYESSPEMNYYGEGPNSSLDDRSLGTYYAVVFRVKAEADQGGVIAFLWDKQEGAWKVVSYDVVDQ